MLRSDILYPARYLAGYQVSILALRPSHPLSNIRHLLACRSGPDLPGRHLVRAGGLLQVQGLSRESAEGMQSYPTEQTNNFE